jgi:hypothetical protein
MKGDFGGLDRPNLDTLIYELGNVGLTIPHSSLNSAPRASGALYLTGLSIDRPKFVFRYFAMIAGLHVPTT